MAEQEPPKEEPPKEEPPKVERPKPYEGPHHFPIQSMTNPCVGNLDLENCVNKWNTAYQSANRLPEGPLAGRFLESMIRESLHKTFNIVFGKGNIESVAIVGFEPINDLDVENFGLKTYYNVRFVLHSNTIDLKPDQVRDALVKKCNRQSHNPSDEDYYLTCAIENQSILLLQNLDLEEYDVCERGVLKCHPWNDCFSKRKHDPDNFNFEKDKIVFECRCKEGFRSVSASTPWWSHFLNHTCEDIDECKEGIDECDPVSTKCVNREGSYDCNCQDGYKRSNETHCIGECGKVVFEFNTFKFKILNQSTISLIKLLLFLLQNCAPTIRVCTANVNRITTSKMIIASECQNFYVDLCKVWQVAKIIDRFNWYLTKFFP